MQCVWLWSRSSPSSIKTGTKTDYPSGRAVFCSSSCERRTTEKGMKKECYRHNLDPSKAVKCLTYCSSLYLSCSTRYPVGYGVIKTIGLT